MAICRRASAGFFFLILTCTCVSVGAATASELLEAINAEDVARVKAALATGADLNEIHEYRGTPLHAAAALDAAEIARLLIAAGADVNAEANKSLRKASPLHVAARVNAVAVAAILIENGATVDSLDTDDRTPLMKAVAYDQTEVAALLLEAGADPLAEEAINFHDTPVYTAAMNGNLDIVRMVLSRGVDVDVRNTKTGETLLWGAADEDHLDVVEYLLTSGADPNIANSSGKAPIDVCDDPKVRAVLRQFGANG